MTCLSIQLTRIPVPCLDKFVSLLTGINCILYMTNQKNSTRMVKVVLARSCQCKPAQTALPGSVRLDER